MFTSLPKTLPIVVLSILATQSQGWKERAKPDLEEAFNTKQLFDESLSLSQ